MSMQNHEIQRIETLKKINNSARMERIALNAQRLFRHKKWQQEAHQQAVNRWGEGSLLNQANVPYQPQQCSAKLAARIVKLSKDIPLFNHVYHYTDVSVLATLFEDGMYDRNLIKQHALAQPPIIPNQDKLKSSESIRFSIHPIDWPQKAAGFVELEFDSQKMLDKNPTLFYQHDDLSRKVAYSHISLQGTMLSFKWWNHEHHTRLTFIDVNHPKVTTQVETMPGKKVPVTDYAQAYAEVPSDLLMPNTLNNPQQCIVLNFFRFLDAIHLANRNKKNHFQVIYPQLEKCSDKALKQFLLDLAPAMTQTAAFTLYGGYQIDFSALTKIKRLNYTLDLSDFVTVLNGGQAGPLLEAMMQMPEIFQSRRFLDYLLKKVHHRLMHSCLLAMKNHSPIKPWEVASLPSEATSVRPSAFNEMKVTLADVFESPHVARLLKKTKILDIHVVTAIHEYLQGNLKEDHYYQQVKIRIAKDALSNPVILNQLRKLPQQLAENEYVFDLEAEREKIIEQRMQQTLEDRKQFEDLFVLMQLKTFNCYIKSVPILEEFLKRQQNDAFYRKMYEAWQCLPEFDSGFPSEFEQEFLRAMVYICHNRLQAPTLEQTRSKAKLATCDNVLTLLTVISKLSVKERLAHDKKLSEALRYGAAVLLRPEDKGVINIYRELYNANLEHLGVLANQLPGHASETICVISLVLMFIGVAATITFLLVPSIPIFAGPFVALLNQAGLYHAAASVGGALGPAAGAGIIGAGIGLATTITGLGLFTNNPHRSVARDVDVLGCESRGR